MPHQPRRFAEVFEFDRNGPPWSGTDGQQEAIRATLKSLAPHSSPFHQVLRKVDRVVNGKGRSFTPISFVDLTPHGWLGFCWPTVIQLHYELHPDWIGRTFIHEVGHLVGWHGLERVDTSERWAEDFRHWAEGGQPEDHPVWERVTGVRFS